MVSCRTNMLKEDEKLLVKNEFKYKEKRIYGPLTLNEYVKQRPNSKLLIFPISLWMYDLSCPELVEVFKAYDEIPKKERNQKVLDSLYIAYGKEEFVGKSESFSRFFYRNGKPPVVVNEKYTQQTARSLRNFHINKGYRHAQVEYEIQEVNQINADKKRKILYKIDAGKPTIIESYIKEIEDPAVASIIYEYEKKSKLEVGENLDEYAIRNELDYYEEALRDNGYFKFNASKEDMKFESDSTLDPYRYPLKLKVSTNDSEKPTFQKNFIGNISTSITSTRMESVPCQKTHADDHTPICNRFYNERGLRFIEDTLTHLRKSLGQAEFERQNQGDTLINSLFAYLDKHASRRKFTRYKDEVLIYPQLIEYGDLYRSSEVSKTKRNYYLFDNFNIRKVDEQFDSKTASVNYIFQLTPKKRQRLEILTELNYSEFLSIGTTIGVESYRRNVFRGAENLSNSLSLTLGTVSNDDADKNSSFLNAFDISFQSSLRFPRWIIFNQLGLGKLKKSTPTSSIEAGISWQNNIGLGRINYNTQLNYFLQPSDFNTHKLSIFNVQYTNHLNPENYFEGRTKDQATINNLLENYYYFYNPQAEQWVNSGEYSIYQVFDYIFEQDDAFLNELSTIDPNLRSQVRYIYRNKEINTQNVLVNSMLYTFSYNQNRDPLIENPWNLYLKLELAGSILRLIDNAFGKNDSHEILGVKYSQFFKIETDIRKQFMTGRNSRIVGRFFFGIGMPFGVSENLPYDRNYIAGGANDMRAWKPFALGPGDSKDDFSLGGFDNLKLLSSLEWRVPLTETIEGALFTDVGNVWGTNKDYEYTFQLDEFYKEVGIGSGLGLRFNFGFLTFRTDWAFKIYNPKYDEGHRWNFDKLGIDSEGLKQSRLNIAIGYPF